MDANELYFSQMKDVDRSTMGSSTTTDENGATIRRSTRERIQWVKKIVTVYELLFELLFEFYSHHGDFLRFYSSILGPLNY